MDCFPNVPYTHLAIVRKPLSTKESHVPSHAPYADTMLEIRISIVRIESSDYQSSFFKRRPSVPMTNESESASLYCTNLLFVGYHDILAFTPE